MKIRTVKGLFLVLGLAGAMTSWADGGTRSLESFQQHHGAFRGEHRGDGGHSEHGGGRVPGVPEPSEWVFMAVGLGLIGAVAHRRQAKH